MPAPRASVFWLPKVVAPSSSRTCNLLELRTWSSILFMVKAGGCGCQTCRFLPTPCCFNPSGSDHNMTQHNKLCIDLHTNTRHTHIEICAQTKKQHLILSKALKSPPPRSPLGLHHHHLLSAAENLLQILLLPTSPNLPSKIAYQLCQSSTKDWSLRSHLHQRSAYQLHQTSTKDCFPRSSICTKDYLPTSPKIAYNFSNPASQKFAYQLPSKIAHKLQLSQLVGPCFVIIIIFFFFFIIHVLLSKISFWVSRFWKILLLFSITLPSSSSPPSP
jgi:hypothetical protein